MAPWRSAWIRSPLLHRHAVHGHVDAEIDHVDIGVRRHDRAGQHLEARRDHRDVADRAVGDDAEAAQRLVHVRLHLAPERAVADVLAVEVLHDHDAGPRRGRDVVEVIEPLLHVAALTERHRVLGLERHGLGEADHRRQVGERAMQVPDRVAGAAALGRDDLHQVAHGRRVDRLQEFELALGRRRHCFPFGAVANRADTKRLRRDRRGPRSTPWPRASRRTMAMQAGQPPAFHARPGRNAPMLPPI